MEEYSLRSSNKYILCVLLLNINNIHITLRLPKCIELTLSYPSLQLACAPSRPLRPLFLNISLLHNYYKYVLLLHLSLIFIHLP